MLVTPRALQLRLNRILKHEGRQIRRSRPGAQRKSLGVYFEIHISTNNVIARRVSLEERAATLFADQDYGRRRWRSRRIEIARDARACVEWATLWLDLQRQRGSLTAEEVAAVELLIFDATEAARSHGALEGT